MSVQSVWRAPADYNKTTLPYLLYRRAKVAFGDRSPLMAFLKVTRRCNLDCEYCPWHTDATNYDQELGTDAWLRILSSLFTRGCRVFAIEGGEPTLRRDLEIFLDEIHELGGIPILASNGTTAPWKFNATGFTVSVDGPERVHDRVRGEGTYKRILRNLRTRGNRRVLCITVLHKRNWQQIQEHLETLAGKVDAFLFTFLYPYHGVPPDLPLSAGEVLSTKETLLSLKSRYPILNPSKFLKGKFSGTDCRDHLSVSVDARGNIRQGCFVDHLEQKRCHRCELSCYQELSALHDLNLEAWFNFYRLFLRTL